MAQHTLTRGRRFPPSDLLWDTAASHAFARDAVVICEEVLCRSNLKPPTVVSDVRCTFCGQGFPTFDSRLSHLVNGCESMCSTRLRDHHAHRDDGNAHHAGPFFLQLQLNVLRLTP